MRITNAKIKNVSVGIDDLNRLAARMTFNGLNKCWGWSFILNRSTDINRLMKLMEYVEVHELNDLENKIVRVAEAEYFLLGFGHPIEDKFIPINTGGEFIELGEKALRKSVAK